MAARRSRARREPVELEIESLSHEGRGVARNDGKTVFVHGALPGERVLARVVKRRGRFDEADTLEVLKASPIRAEPACAHYGMCGGCSLQHLPETEQLAHKQSVLLELLQHHAGLEPAELLAPVRGPQWGYRRKARLGIKQVKAKGGVITGFRERNKPYVTDCNACDTLDPRVGQHLPELRELFNQLSVPDRIPQIEISMSDDVCALIVRHLEPLSDDDQARLIEFAGQHNYDIYLQSGGIDTVTPLTPARVLRYRLGDIELEFLPTDFTQVNAAINQQLVPAAMQYLALEAHDHVIDFFCGMGNFSLPIATRAASVTGIEGDAALVQRAAHNASVNQLTNVEFHAADLMDGDALAKLPVTAANKLLLDPPRAGAEALINALDFSAITRLVYVSCNPATLARDAAVLGATHGFELSAAGILDMFPQTAHVESISVFEKR